MLYFADFFDNKTMEHKLNKENKPVQPLQVGITGGIGSGKTTACKIFESFGIPVYNADERAKQIMVEDEDLKQEIVKNFGVNAYFPDGQLNREFLANIVFNEPGRLKILNSLVHPAVGLDGLKWHQSQTGVPYTIREAALLIESGSYKMMDYLILVTAPEQVRIERVMTRDNTTEAAVLARMEKQMPEQEKATYADFCINNDSRSSLIKQVFEIHQQLKKLAAPEPH